MSLKNFDAKGFLIDHGEKLAFGLFALLSLGALGTAQWSRYPKAPEEIIAKVTEARGKVQASTWPDEKRSGFTLQDYMARTHEVRGPMAASRYEFSTNLWWPLYRKQELAKEPELVAVEYLDAKSGFFALGLAPKAPVGGSLLADGSSGPADGTTTPAAPAGDDEFGLAVRTPAATGGLDGASSGFSLPGTSAGALMPTGTGNPYDGGTALTTDSSGMMGMAANPGMETRGYRFIAVRGVWDLQTQLDKFMRALNLQTRAEARSWVELTDFVLERQTAIAGSDPWAGPWEALTISRAQEVLEEAYDYDFDGLDPRVTDMVITMPLPARIVGRWGDYATHPKIKNFELSPVEAAREKALHDKIIEEFDKAKKSEEALRGKDRGGFAKNTRNVRGMAETIMGTDSGSMRAFDNDMTKWMGADTTGVMRMSLPDLKARLKSAADRLVLFRYFDFDVRPGYAYRYRVKLELRNPNYNKQVEQVVEPSVVQGPTRVTPFSKESNAAVVPESVNYFLKDVDRDPVNEAKLGSAKPLANFYFVEWDSNVGTMIADTVQIKTFGQFLGEKRKSLRLNVGKPSLKDEEVVFRADDLFLDGQGDVKVAIEDHKDLKLPTQNKGHLGLLAAAVVVDRSGDVIPVDPTSNATREKVLKDRVERERAPFEHLKNKEEATTSPLDGGMFPGAGTSADGMMMDGMQPKGKKKKVSRKPTSSVSSSGSSSGRN